MSGNPLHSLQTTLYSWFYSRHHKKGRGITLPFVAPNIYQSANNVGENKLFLLRNP